MVKLPRGSKGAPSTPGAEQHVRALLLEIAAKEFASRGFSGACLELVAAQAGITRAMIYYYFGGREGLYVAVLDAAYNAIWNAEQAIRTEGISPKAALRKLVEFRVNYYIENPAFVSLVSIENQHEARYLTRSKTVPKSATPSLEYTAAVLAEGAELLAAKSSERQRHLIRMTTRAGLTAKLDFVPGGSEFKLAVTSIPMPPDSKQVGRAGRT